MKKNNPYLIACATSLLAATSSFAATYTWDGGSTNARWDTALNWDGDVTPTFNDTADIRIAGNVGLNQILRSSTTIRSLEFTDTNVDDTTIGLVANNGTTARNLIFDSNTDVSTLTIDAASTGVKIFNNVGEVILENELNIVKNSASGNIDFASAVTGTGDIDIAGSGGGTVLFRNTNTFIGDLTIGSGHKVNALNGSQLKFTVGVNGVNTGIFGTGDLVWNGTALLDLSSADAAVGNSWTIVDVGSLNASNIFRSNFALETTAGGAFVEDNQVWSLTQDGIDYRFEESTGTLSVVPEPGTYALLAGLAGLTYVMLGRRRA